jgi:hypothetical protein
MILSNSNELLGQGLCLVVLAQRILILVLDVVQDASVLRRP